MHQKKKIKRMAGVFWFRMAWFRNVEGSPGKREKFPHDDACFEDCDYGADVWIPSSAFCGVRYYATAENHRDRSSAFDDNASLLRGFYKGKSRYHWNFISVMSAFGIECECQGEDKDFKNDCPRIKEAFPLYEVYVRNDLNLLCGYDSKGAAFAPKTVLYILDRSENERMARFLRGELGNDPVRELVQELRFNVDVVRDVEKAAASFESESKKQKTSE
jgi:hypothetical protein